MSRRKPRKERQPSVAAPTVTAPSAPTRGLPVWLLPALVAATLAAYQPAWHGGLLWDDNRHLTPAALQSITGLWRIWFDVGATQQYTPVAHSAFWVMQRLWGDDTLGYHLVNIVLHAGSAWIVAAILRRLAIPGAVVAALIFALHPVHVESVAWMSELKNVLSGLFYLGAALLYLRFDAGRRPRDYALALALFALAVLSKTVTATLPAGLLVVFWWQRGRIDWTRDVRPLAPFFLLGLASGVMTAWVEHTYIGARGMDFQITPVERVLVAGSAVLFYLRQLVWPAHLVFIYPRWVVSQAIWWQYLYPLLALTLAGLAWRYRTRSRAPLAAVLFFGGTLFPALGFVNVYPFRYAFVADHFQYLASLGIIAIVAAGLATLARPWTPAAGVAGAVALAAALGALTWRQSAQYASAETLYRATIARSPTSWLARNNLAVLLLHRSRAGTEEAVSHLREALRYKADYPEAHLNLGIALEELGHLQDAVVEFRTVIGLVPAQEEPHRRLASVLRRLGLLNEALAEYRIAVRLDPTHADTHSNLGGVLMQLNRFDEAAVAQREALRLRPDHVDAHFNLGTSLMRMGQFDAALAEFTETLRLQPNDASAHRNAGTILLTLGRNADAAAHYREALRLRPDDAEARAGLARAVR